MFPADTFTMKLTGFRFFCCCFLAFFISIVPSASGHPLPTSSPEQIVAVAGKDVNLPCNVNKRVASLNDVTVEWLRTNGPSNLQVHALRFGHVLEKEQAEEYRERTAIMRNCSLTLRGVQVRDSGTYKCVILQGRDKQEVSVSLFVAEVFEVNLSVWRTSANQLIVRCESSGWSQKPVVSLLDSDRNNVIDQIEASVRRPDGLYSVQTFINLTAAAVTITKNGTLICRAEIPGMNLWNETKISFTDEFNASSVNEAPRGPDMVVVAIILFGVGVGVGVGVFLRRKQQSGVRDSERSSDQEPNQPLLSDPEPKQLPPSDSETYAEYGDINKVETTGASQYTANSMNSTGTKASEELAQKDIEKLSDYKEQIIRVGTKLKVHPALIAGIISRQTEAGKKLRPDGYGESDRNCFGLMQINKHYHAVKGNPFSEEHVDQGVTYLIQLILTMRRTKPNWTKEQQLKGALACYIAGEDKVIPLEYKDIDSVTPYEDFANDVIARAKWFAQNGF